MVTELGLADTNGILRQPWIEPARTSAGLGWERLYVSTQAERPYRSSFCSAQDASADPAPGRAGLGAARTRQARHAAHGCRPAACSCTRRRRDLTVELGGDLHTVHVYLTDEAVQEAAGRHGPGGAGGGARASPTRSSSSSFSALTGWCAGGSRRRGPTPTSCPCCSRPTSPRYHAVRGACLGADRTRPGLSRRQLATVREMMEARLAEPIPLADLAADVVAVRQPVQQAVQGEHGRDAAPLPDAPARSTMACRLLRGSTVPIAEVATRCGFSHQEHLTRVLRAQLATTPAAVRRGA